MKTVNSATIHSIAAVQGYSVSVDSPVAKTAGASFGQALSQIKSPEMNGGNPNQTWVVRKGQNLTSIVREQWRLSQEKMPVLSDQMAHRLALQMAKDNHLPNPDLIMPGQQLDAQNVKSMIQAKLAPYSQDPSFQSQPLVQDMDSEMVNESKHSSSLLQRTLERAIAKGYIPVEDREKVESRIQQLATKHKFHADDFARAALMESDGFNPEANNGRCFGIIQFCGGVASGAASVGFEKKAKEITKLSVLDQLNLVDHYFDDTQLSRYASNSGRVKLDDLYLTILTPAARAEQGHYDPLPISGLQALALHPGKDRQSPITRNSIIQGLNSHAQATLSTTKSMR
jgi:hypothetical protein